VIRGAVRIDFFRSLLAKTSSEVWAGVCRDGDQGCDGEEDVGDSIDEDNAKDGHGDGGTAQANVRG